MVKPSIKYAVLCGLFLTALFWVSVKIGSNPLLEVRHFFFDLVIYFLFIYFAEREYKYYYNGGYLHFWQGMSIAFIVYIPAAVIFCIFLILIFQIDHSMMENYRQGALTFLENQKDFLLERISPEQYQERVDDVENVTVRQLIISSGVKKVLAGLFVTPIVSIILRKKPK